MAALNNQNNQPDSASDNYDPNISLPVEERPLGLPADKPIEEEASQPLEAQTFPASPIKVEEIDENQPEESIIDIPKPVKPDQKQVKIPGFKPTDSVNKTTVLPNEPGEIPLPSEIEIAKPLVKEPVRTEETAASVAIEKSREDEDIEKKMPLTKVETTEPTAATNFSADEPPLPPVDKKTADKPPVGGTYSKSGFKFKKILIILLALILIAAAGAGAYFYLWPRLQKTTGGQEKTLVYWGLWENEEVFKSVIEEWEKVNPNIKIKYQRKEKNQYRETLQSALARGEGPDIFRFHNTWLPMFRDELASLPVSVMSASQFEQTFYPTATNDLRQGASIYGIPLEIDTLALFYNVDQIRAAGKEEVINDPDLTWDELRKLALELTVRDNEGQVKIAGIAMGETANIDHWSDILGLMMLQNGVDLSNPQKLQEKLAQDALVFYTYFSSRDRVWNPLFPRSTMAFAGGRVALYFGFSWDVFEIRETNKELNFKVRAVPQIPERDPVAWASYWVEGVSKKSEVADEAWQFLQFLSQPDTLSKLYKAASNERLFGEPYSRQDMAAQLTNDPIVAAFVNQAPYARSWYLCSRTFDNGINDTMIKYFEDAVNAQNTGSNLTTILPTLVQGVAQTLNRYKITR